MPTPGVLDFTPRPACPACGTPGVQRFQRSFSETRLRSALTAFYAEVGGLDYAAVESGSYAVASCPHCGTWYQTSTPSDALLARLYEQWIDPEKARLRFHHNHSPDHTLHVAREVAPAHRLISNAPRVALDYGCGWGEWSRMTQAFGFETWGTELSPSRREHAKAIGVRVVDDADLPDAHFGLINIDQVLEHMPNPRACLVLLSTKLHLGGLLRLAVPNPHKVGRALKHFDRELARPRLGGLNAIAPLEHLNAFTQHGLILLAKEAGLVRVRPKWRDLLATTVIPPGVAAASKAILRPFYLRSRHTTQLFFRRASAER